MKEECAHHATTTMMYHTAVCKNLETSSRLGVCCSRIEKVREDIGIGYIYIETLDFLLDHFDLCPDDLLCFKSN
jgi:hypothetical protein